MCVCGAEIIDNEGIGMIHILFKNEYLVKKNKVQCVNESHVICMFVYLLYITHILNMQDSSSMENEFSCSCDVMGCTCLYVLVTVNMPQY